MAVFLPQSTSTGTAASCADLTTSSSGSSLEFGSFNFAETAGNGSRRGVKILKNSPVWSRARSQMGNPNLNGLVMTF